MRTSLHALITALETGGFRVLPCAICRRDGLIRVHDLHALLQANAAALERVRGLVQAMQRFADQHHASDDPKYEQARVTAHSADVLNAVLTGPPAPAPMTGTLHDGQVDLREPKP